MLTKRGPSPGVGLKCFLTILRTVASLIVVPVAFDASIAILGQPLRRLFLLISMMRSIIFEPNPLRPSFFCPLDPYNVLYLRFTRALWNFGMVAGLTMIATLLSLFEGIKKAVAPRRILSMTVRSGDL